jgi:outer membrane protein TolC
VRSVVPIAASVLLLGWALAPGAARAQSQAAQTSAADASRSQSIDLATALRLAGMNNLDLATVRAAQRQAKAANDSATLRFFPYLTVGETYARRTGLDQATAGTMQDVYKQLYRGGGTLTMGVDLGSAIFGKLAARQLQSAAEHSVEARRNDTLRAAAAAYFDLVNAAAGVGIAEEAVRISQDYQQQLERAVAIGLTNRSEALRVAVQTRQAQVQLRGAQARQRVDAAALASVLRLDPSLVLRPAERLVVPPTIVPLGRSVDELIRTAMMRRPELEASAAEVSAAEHDRTAAKYGPLIPSVRAAATYARTRGGANGAVDAFQPTHDYVVGVSWRFGPGGLFDFSRTEAAQASLDRREISDEKLRQGIAQQVVDALAAAQAARDQMRLAREGVQLAEKSLSLSMQRRQFGVYAVTEIIQAQQDLTRSRNSYAGALAQYAKAQYALAQATGVLGDRQAD